jgi:hypothetical protein
MNTEINFRIQGRHQSHHGTAVIVDNYSEGVIDAKNNLPGEGRTLTTEKIGGYDGFAIYENYYDSGSVDYFYFAIAVGDLGF